jgi:hypothetical protein
MDTTPTAALLREIERFLAKTGMAPTSFGDRALGDPSLVNNLRNGRELRFRTLMKVKSFMAATTPARERQRQSA